MGQVATFQNSYRLIPWDMRGHGRTECPEDVSYYSQLLTDDDMAALLDHLQIEQAEIAGHSLGGFMSLSFNVAHPGRVKALVLQGCGPGYRRDEPRLAWNERSERRAQTLDYPHSVGERKLVKVCRAQQRDWRRLRVAFSVRSTPA